MIRKILGVFVILYSSWCFANSVNLEISDVAIPTDLTQVPQFLNFESTNVVNVPVESGCFDTILGNVNNQLAHDLSQKYTSLTVISLESGILTDVTHPEIESHNYTINNKTPFKADYVLYGQLKHFNSFITANQVESTGQQSLIYHLDIAIHYQLIRVSDKKVMADFISVGSVGDATIKSTTTLPNYTKYLPTISSELYNSTYNGLVRAIINKDLLESSLITNNSNEVSTSVNQ